MSPANTTSLNGAVSPVLDYLKKIHRECAQNTGGDAATEIFPLVTGRVSVLLTLADFDTLKLNQLQIKIKLPHNLCLALSSKLRKANRERSVFD